MSDVTFSRLIDLPPREAWANEARAFTPWLSENIDQLGEAIGMRLELTGTEVAVETFAADILARDLMDDTLVLIENQLETTDHTHLGQIMTYLAGLNAHTVVWIAPGFREPHLSAIRWLNEHTADGFSFFAVKLRVVRIGDSPFAPVFEVIEKPNGWEREVRQKAQSEGAAYYDVKAEFWTEMLARHPELADLGMKPWRYPNNYIVMNDEPRIELSVFIGKASAGAFLRAGWGEDPEPVLALLTPHRAALETALETSLGPSGRGKHFLFRQLPVGHDDRTRWPEIMDWMTRMIADYRRALEPALKG